MVPLFNVNPPTAAAVAYATRLRSTVGNYITEEEASWRRS